jgi:hypothetical protein
MEKEFSAGCANTAWQWYVLVPRSGTGKTMESDMGRTRVKHWQDHVTRHGGDHKARHEKNHRVRLQVIHREDHRFRHKEDHRVRHGGDHLQPTTLNMPNLIDLER